MSSSSSSPALKPLYLFLIVGIYIFLRANNGLLFLSSIFFNFFKSPPFVSALSTPSVNTLPNGEYSNFACSNASGLYHKSFLVKYSYLGKSPLE